MAQIRSRCREIRIRMVNEIIKKIEELSGQYSGYEIFSDWIKAVAKHAGDKRKEERR